jgi:hypothetical protein
MSAPKKKGRPRKVQREQGDQRTPVLGSPDYSDPDQRQQLKDTVKDILSAEVPDDDPCFSRAPDQDEVDALAATARQCTIDNLRVDPFGDEPLANLMGSIILNRSTPYFEELAGQIFVKALKHEDPEVASQFFERVMKMRRNADSPHRNAYAYYAYSRFIEEVGREPSKPELKAYIQARRDEFRDAPGDGDGKGWTRLWEGAGLTELAEG